MFYWVFSSMEKETIYVRSLSASKVSIEVTNEIMLREIYEFFKFKDPTHKPNRYSKWDGVVRLFDNKKQVLPRGLVRTLFEFCKSVNYDIKIDKGIFFQEKVELEELEEYVESLKLTGHNENGYFDLTPYDYQMHGFYEGITNDSCVLLADTNAGKTLILYLLSRFFCDVTSYKAKILIIVPSVMLVDQMYDDFGKFSYKDDKFSNQCIHTIKGGVKDKYRSAPITVSTWQSIQNEDPEFFCKFTHVFCDEVHGASAEKISYILNNCINAYKRIGVTGSMRDTELHTLQVLAHFGKIIRIATTQMLKERGQSADTLIRVLNFKYRRPVCLNMDKLDYEGKIRAISESKERNSFIAKFANKLEGNTLLLFVRKKHSKAVYDMLKEMGHSNVYRIDGDVPNDIRDQMKKAVENGEKVVLCASFGTLGTGVSIRKLHNLVLCHPIKSIIAVLQAIGRMLRTHSSKKIANIYDIVDDFRLSPGSKATFIEHGAKRYGYYKSKGHNVVTKVVDCRHWEFLPVSQFALLLEESDKRKKFKQELAEKRFNGNE
ncbi:helicase protein [Vibrio phage vB_VchM_Kuja]|uniref:Helicase protein n=1 Tax=Vibrio phage vB_VchM_Kuja TaxID=2686437 RepID=A0A6B9J5L5_9CAUD|nr:DNA helicase [Vibrio phage vB_VchM_Kuja]QGZ16145.1 helicase protein [Vibrio phage vB_VchM_Kuja]